MSEEKEIVKEEETVTEKSKKELKAEKKEEKKALKQVEELEEKNRELLDKITELNKKYEETDKEKDLWKNKYYQAYADLSNTRKQIEKEGQEFKDYANKSLITELIPVLDSFDMAFKTEPEDEKIKNYLIGFKMIYSKLLEFLDKMHVEVISPEIGADYNPHLMEALSVIPGEEDNKIKEVFYKGYKLHSSLLRAASVLITKKQENEQKSEESEKASDSEEK